MKYLAFHLRVILVTLRKCYELNINPLERFKTMVLGSESTRKKFTCGNAASNAKFLPKHRHTSGPLISGLKGAIQYKAAKLENFVLKLSNGDNS